ncbi:hypothetical protein BDN67DRAFT_963041 [Paxillus ammoniavirescens]|nr:hypothetical protein BDN67DRAFT_963041 [Paxillus ammoniavirescens]
MVASSEERARLDPYSRIAENKDVALQDKITDLHTVTNAIKTGMLVTRDSNGNLHSRPMNLASPLDDLQLNLIFLANNASSKFDELENDFHVNVSFFDPSSTDWVSYAGKARVTQDRNLIHENWSALITGYIGDLGDGVHRGDEKDPRVAVIEIIPNEIKYWISQRSHATRTLQVAAGAVTGKATAPGELRTITKDEIQSVQQLHAK